MQQENRGGDTYMPGNPLSTMPPYLPGTPLSPETPWSLRKHQKFPDPSAKRIESVKKNHMLCYKTCGYDWRLKKDSNLQPFG